MSMLVPKLHGKARYLFYWDSVHMV